VVDPRSVEQISRAIEQIVSETCCRQSLRDIGLARAERFSWERTAQTVHEVLWSSHRMEVS
jgi:glycosyltransferase involved in cell wall biosynthesis